MSNMTFDEWLNGEDKAQLWDEYDKYANGFTEEEAYLSFRRWAKEKWEGDAVYGGGS